MYIPSIIWSVVATANVGVIVAMSSEEYRTTMMMIRTS